MGTRMAAFDIWRVREGRRVGILGDYLVDIGLGERGCGDGSGGGVRVKIRVVDDFAETGDTAIPAMPTPTPSMRRVER